MPAKIYDWDAWFAASAFELRRGEDYVCSQSSICQQIRTQATRRHVRVVVIELDDGVRVKTAPYKGSR